MSARTTLDSVTAAVTGAMCSDIRCLCKQALSAVPSRIMPAAPWRWLLLGLLCVETETVVQDTSNLPVSYMARSSTQTLSCPLEMLAVRLSRRYRLTVSFYPCCRDLRPCT